MNKSKSWIKSLLIVVMAALLVFTLVACDKTPKDTQEPVPSDVTTGEFFEELWNLTESIGSEKIEANDTVSLQFGATVTVGVRAAAEPFQLIQQIDLGMEVHAVIGRTESAAKEKTALKIRLYDPTNNESGEILTAYLFAKDLNNLYIDFAGNHIKVPNTVADSIWKKALGNTTDLADNIYSGLTNKFIGKEGSKMSVNDILQAFVGDFGPNWNLNSLLNKAISLMGIDLDKIIEENEGIKNTVDMVLQGLGYASLDSIKDASGNFDLKKILANPILEDFFTVKASRAENGGVLFNCSAGPLIMSALKSFAGDLFYNSGTALDQVYNDLAFRFTRKSGAITDFSIFAKLGGMQRMMQYNGQQYNVVPEVELKINKLAIRKAADDEIKLNGTYTEDIAVNESLTVDLTGISYKDTNLNNAKVELGVVGKLDIVNIQNNQTKLNVFADVTVGGTKTRVLSASFNDGKITVVFDKAYEFNGKEYKGVMVDVSKQFNMAEFVQNGIVDIVNNIKNAGKSAAEEEAVEQPTFMQLLVKCVKAALPMIQTDNDLTITSNNILASVVLFYNIANGYDEVPEHSNAWTVENRIEAITNSLTNPNPELADKSIMDCVKIILGEFNIDLDKITTAADDTQTVENKKADWNKIGDAVIKIASILAQDLKVDGVTGGYADIIEAALKAKITIHGDLKNGVHASIKAEFANASITITESLNVVSTANGGYTFFDNYTAYQNDQNKDQWFVKVLEAKK